MKKKEIEFYINGSSLVKNILFVDGLTRAGKFFLGKLLAGFEGIDYFQAISIIEQIPFFVKLGGMTEDAGIALISKVADEFSYNIRIGRHLNTRIKDASSIYNHPDFAQFIRRSLDIFGEIHDTSFDIIKSFRESGIYSTFVTHEVYPNLDFFIKAFPKMKMIYLHRNPVDLVSSWYVRGWGKRFGSDPLALTPVIESSGGPVPWHCYAWKDEFYTLSEADRTIKCVLNLFDLCKDSYKKTGRILKEKILYLKYENLVEKPDPVLDNIAKFLGKKKMPYLDQLKIREKIPGTGLREKRKEKLSELKQLCTPLIYQSLIEYSDRYDQEENPFK